MNHQCLLQLLLVGTEVSMELAPPGQEKTFKIQTWKSQKRQDMALVLPVGKLSPPLSDGC